MSHSKVFESLTCHALIMGMPYEHSTKVQDQCVFTVYFLARLAHFQVCLELKFKATFDNRIVESSWLPCLITVILISKVGQIQATLLHLIYEES